MSALGQKRTLPLIRRCQLLAQSDMDLRAANVRSWGQSGHLGRENINALSRYAIGPRSNGAKATAQSNWQKQALEQAVFASLLNNSDLGERGHEHHLDHYNRLHCGHGC
jgi:hypothetical protein